MFHEAITKIWILPLFMRPSWNLDLTLSKYFFINHAENWVWPFPHFMTAFSNLYLTLSENVFWYHVEVWILPFPDMFYATVLNSGPYPFHKCLLKPCWNLDLTLSKCALCIHVEHPFWWGPWVLVIAPVVYPTGPPWSSPIWCVWMLFHPHPVERKKREKKKPQTMSRME